MLCQKVFHVGLEISLTSLNTDPAKEWNHVCLHPENMQRLSTVNNMVFGCAGGGTRLLRTLWTHHTVRSSCRSMQFNAKYKQTIRNEGKGKLVYIQMRAGAIRLGPGKACQILCTQKIRAYGANIYISKIRIYIYIYIYIYIQRRERERERE